MADEAGSCIRVFWVRGTEEDGTTKKLENSRGRQQGSDYRREREVTTRKKLWNLQNSAALTIESAVRLFFTSEISPKKKF